MSGLDCLRNALPKALYVSEFRLHKHGLIVEDATEDAGNREHACHLESEAAESDSTTVVVCRSHGSEASSFPRALAARFIRHIMYQVSPPVLRLHPSEWLRDA